MDESDEITLEPSKKRSRVDGYDSAEDEETRPAATATAPSRGGRVAMSIRRTKSSLPFGSVVKLHVKKAPWSYMAPWRKESQLTCTGTGFLISGRRILTNAHVVEQQVSVLVQAQSNSHDQNGGTPEKFVAEVLHEGIPCDLAVLTVEDERFWKGKVLLELSEELPELDENVTCVGYPIGGENISVTRGVVSRIDISREALLRIQIDAAINPGNSGGPVFNSLNHVVGVARAHLKNASNIGYVIPSQVVRSFLNATENPGGYKGIGHIWVPVVQSLESPCLRSKLKLGSHHTGGIRVCSVEPLGPSYEKLQVNDVMLSIDGIPIARDATVQLRGEERIYYIHLITRKPVGSTLKIGLLRDGTELEVEVEIQPPRYLVPRCSGWDIKPSYLIVGGLVFVPLSRPWTKEVKLPAFAERFTGMVRTEGHQIIMLSKVLAHKVNFGYHSFGPQVLDSLNGIQVLNLSHLAHLVETCTSDLYEFSFVRLAEDASDESSKVSILVVLNVEQCKAAAKEIFSQHMIQSPSLISEPSPTYVPS